MGTFSERNAADKPVNHSSQNLAVAKTSVLHRHASLPVCASTTFRSWSGIDVDAERWPRKGPYVTLHATAASVDSNVLGRAANARRPCSTAANATAQNLPGMGLGLYISRQIVEAHGGRIWASSAGEGQGTTFTVSLTAGVADAPNGSGEDAVWSAAEGPTSSLSGIVEQPDD